MSHCLRRLSLLSIVIFAVPVTVFAGGIDNNNEFTATKIRTFTRAASTEVDAAFYNPAGLIHLDEGFHVMLGNLFVFDDYQNTLANGTELDGYAKIYAVPSLALALNKGDWAGYFHFNVPGGGGSVKYDDGSPTSYGLANEIANGTAQSIGAVSGLNITDGHATGLTHQLAATSFYLGFTAGGALKVNDMVSLSLAGRFIRATTTIDAAASFGVDGTQFAARDLIIDVENKYEEYASGFGWIAGAHITPFEELDIGLRIEGRTDLHFNTKQLVNEVSASSAFLSAASPGAIEAVVAGVTELADSSGVRKRRDLPPLLGLGVAYQVMPDLRAAVAFHAYLNRMANWEGDQKNYDHSWEGAASVEYAIFEGFVASLGFLYSDIGSNDQYYGLAESAEFDAMTIGAGVGYEVINGLIIDAAYSRSIYTSIDSEVNGIELAKVRNTGSIALRYSL